MIKLIAKSGFIGTRLSNSSSEFCIINKDMSKIFENFCSITDIRDTDCFIKTRNSEHHKSMTYFERYY